MADEIDDLIPGLEEVEAVPLTWGSHQYRYEQRVYKQLAARIAGLPELKRAIKLSHKWPPEEIGAVRHFLIELGFKLVCRTRPGETYFWRGERKETKQQEGGVIRSRLQRRSK